MAHCCQKLLCHECFDVHPFQVRLLPVQANLTLLSPSHLAQQSALLFVLYSTPWVYAQPFLHCKCPPQLVSLEKTPLNSLPSGRPSQARPQPSFMPAHGLILPCIITNRILCCNYFLRQSLFAFSYQRDLNKVRELAISTWPEQKGNRKQGKAPKSHCLKIFYSFHSFVNNYLKNIVGISRNSVSCFFM